MRILPNPNNPVNPLMTHLMNLTIFLSWRNYMIKKKNKNSDELTDLSNSSQQEQEEGLADSDDVENLNEIGIRSKEESAGISNRKSTSNQYKV